jgi:hypothetical protein
LASLGVTIYLLFIVYTKGRKLIFRGDNSIVSLSEEMNYEDIGKVRVWNETAKPLLEVLENGDNTVDLEATNAKRYMHKRLTQYVKTFDTGELKIEKLYYPIPLCDEDNFKRNEFEE